MTKQRVLISGAGVAGSITAYWLAKASFEVVVVERSRANQKLGQGLEIEEPALQVVREMGLYEKLKAITTGEQGFKLVDEADRCYGKLEVGKHFSPTGALEMMRGDMTEVFYKAADELEGVKYLFETVVRGVDQIGEKVVVQLGRRKGEETWREEFDFVIGADGARSQTRDMVMGTPEELQCYKKVGAYVAYFSIPKEERDFPYSKACHFPGRRIIWTRPIGRESKETSTYFIIAKDNIPKLSEANASGDRQKQKEALAEVYSGCGWETKRIMEQMMTTNNFYSDELTQIKLSKWSKGRYALVGDAAWAPTPFTGAGNHLAILGAWTLAQEMGRSRDVSAFERYEGRMRKYVEDAQQIPLGGRAPKLFLPETKLGIWAFRAFAQLFTWIVNVYSAVNPPRAAKGEPGQDHEPFDLQIGQNENAKH